MSHILQELGYDNQQNLSPRQSLKCSDARVFVERNGFASLEDMDQDALCALYNIVVADTDEERIPYYGPYNVPKDALISALRSHKKLDLEQYKEKGLPEDIVF